MHCPICHRLVEEASREHPFCSRRCRTIDLGRWASGAYRVPVRSEGEDETDLAPEGGEKPN
ncbi:MAG: DNA gyrase inhibitor YacG [Terriglobales bacterium]